MIWNLRIKNSQIEWLFVFHLIERLIQNPTIKNSGRFIRLKITRNRQKLQKLSIFSCSENMTEKVHVSHHWLILKLRNQRL